MNEEYVRKYIEEHPYEFKQNIIALCRQMDKEDVYEWLVIDEREINRLVQENEQLKSQLEQRDNIMNKVREFIKTHQRKDEFLHLNEWQTRDLLEILDKENR